MDRKYTKRGESRKEGLARHCESCIFNNRVKGSVKGRFMIIAREDLPYLHVCVKCFTRYWNNKARAKLKGTVTPCK